MSITNEIILEFSKLSKFAVHKEYRIVPGDNLWDIAKRFKVSVEDLQTLNSDLNPATLQPGQVIKIPEPKEVKPAPKKEVEDFSQIKTQQGSITNLQQLENAITEAARKQNIPLEIFRGLVAAESSGNPKAAAVSKNPNAGAMGLTQLSPYARKALNVSDPYDIKQNLAAGAKWLKLAYQEATRLKNTSKDLWVYALMIYHAGMRAVQKWIDAGEPSQGFGMVGEKTIKYPKQVFMRGRDPSVFSSYWPE